MTKTYTLAKATIEQKMRTNKIDQLFLKCLESELNLKSTWGLSREKNNYPKGCIPARSCENFERKP